MSLGVGKLATASGSSVPPDRVRKGVASDSKEPPGASLPGESLSTGKPRSLCSAKSGNKTIPGVHLTQALNDCTSSIKKR